MDKLDNSRRDFIKKSALTSAGLALGVSAKSYGRIQGANDRVNFAVVGLNGRGKALARAVATVKDTNIGYICDVDSRILEPTKELVNKITGQVPKAHTDYRELLEINDLDALAIATPDHWHAPMTIMGVKAGKNVYVEKPCSHNPAEGELLVAAQKKYGKVIQMGTQQRSAPTSIQAVEDIRNGIIGKAYFGKAWYSNKRGSIGTGKQTPVPEWLDWELWQGPAPRMDYKDNLVHYNWHWFWNWGTGEINNNGTHEIDICRWALGVDYPLKVNSSGGRYHFKDDWQFYDTQIANFEFEGDKLITWEGRSCNDHRIFGRGRGVTIHGTKGTIMLDRNGYFAYDQDGNIIKELKEEKESATTDIIGAGSLDLYHMQNFVNGIKSNEKLNSPIEEGHKSNLLCHLGNISQKQGKTLSIDTQSGKILNDPKAMQMWAREYQKDWEPTV